MVHAIINECHCGTFLYSNAMHVMAWKESSYILQDSKIICSVVALYYYIGKEKWKLVSPSYSDICCLAQNGLIANNSTVLVLQLYYISFGTGTLLRESK